MRSSSTVTGKVRNEAFRVSGWFGVRAYEPACPDQRPHPCRKRPAGFSWSGLRLARLASPAEPAHTIRKEAPMLTALRITLDGELQTIRIQDTTLGAQVDDIQKQVGCDTFDVVGLPEDISLYVDDEGVYRSEPNATLTLVARAFGFEGVLFGQGVFLGFEPTEGDTLSLTPAQIERITDAHRAHRHYGRIVLARLQSPTA